MKFKGTFFLGLLAMIVAVSVLSQSVQNRRPWVVELDQLVGVTNVIQRQINAGITNDASVSNHFQRTPTTDWQLSSTTTNNATRSAAGQVHTVWCEGDGYSMILTIPNAGGNAYREMLIRPFGTCTVTLTNGNTNVFEMSGAPATQYTNSVSIGSNAVRIVSLGQLTLGGNWYVEELQPEAYAAGVSSTLDTKINTLSNQVYQSPNRNLQVLSASGAIGSTSAVVIANAGDITIETPNPSTMPGRVIDIFSLGTNEIYLSNNLSDSYVLSTSSTTNATILTTCSSNDVRLISDGADYWYVIQLNDD